MRHTNLCPTSTTSTAKQETANQDYNSKNIFTHLIITEYLRISLAILVRVEVLKLLTWISETLLLIIISLFFLI